MNALLPFTVDLLLPFMLSFELLGVGAFALAAGIFSVIAAGVLRKPYYSDGMGGGLSSIGVGLAMLIAGTLGLVL